MEKKQEIPQQPHNPIKNGRNSGNIDTLYMYVTTHFPGLIHAV